MALLAEPKRKAKFGLDPRNTNWSNDDTKIGQRLMEKMGWEKGKGLGANEDGMKEHIKASYKSDSRGLGFTAKDADAWIAHQDDFNELLRSLNSQSGSEKPNGKIKEEQRPPDGQKRYRGRFARGSVQTLRSVEDLDCIFGKRKSKSNNDSGSEAEEHKHGLTSVTSTTSVQEYFAKKMAEMKARKEGSTKVDDDDVNTSRQSTSGKETSEKRVPPVYGNVMFNYEENTPDTTEWDDTEKISGTKHDRGWYQEWPGDNDQEPESETRKKKKKKKDKNPLKDSDVIETVSEEVVISTTKKHKKEKTCEVNSSEGGNNKNVSSSVVDNSDDNDKLGEFAETGESSKSTKRSKKNKRKGIEIEDRKSANRKKVKDDSPVNGLGVTECIEGGGIYDVHGFDLIKPIKHKNKKVHDGVESSKKQDVVQDAEIRETRHNSKRKRDSSNITDTTSDATQDAESVSAELDVDKVKRKKRKKDNQDQICSEEKSVDDSITEREIETKKSKKKKKPKESEVSDDSGMDQKFEAYNHLVDQNAKTSDIKRALRIAKKQKKLNRKKREKEKMDEIKKQKEAANSIFPGSNISDIKGYAVAGANIPSHEKTVNKFKRTKRSKKKKC